MSVAALFYYAYAYLPRQMYKWQRRSLQAFARAMELRSGGRFGDSKKVARMAVEVAEALRLSPKRRRQLELAVYLRDIGMAAVPHFILNAERPLSTMEQLTLDRHVEIGASMVEQIPNLQSLKRLVLLHHARYDRHPKIMLEAHILSALSSFFEIAWSHGLDRAVLALKQGAGTLYHPRVAAAIIDHLPTAGGAALDAPENVQAS